MNYKNNRTIFWIVYLAYVSIYVARVNLSMAGPELISDNVLNTVQLGILGSIFSSIYAVGRFLNGGLGDKTPPWVMLTVGLFVAGLSNVFISFLPPFIGIFFWWTTNAYAQSMLWSSVLCVVSAMYKGDEAKRKMSLMVTSVALGNILAIILNSFLITKFGVGYAFLVPGILTILLGIAVFFSTREIKPILSAEKNHLSVLKLLKDKTMMYMSVPAIMHGVMKENISLWMTVFIVDKYCVDLSVSSYYILLIPFIGFVGRTIYPLAYKICNNRENVVSMVGFVICIMASVLLCAGKIGMLLSVILLALIYAAVSMINTSILSVYPLYYIETGNVASVSGIMDFATYLGGGVASVIYGVVIASFGYTPMFVSWAIISAVSVLMIVKINRSKKSENFN